MNKIINVIDSLKGTPRPHYLVGNAKISQDSGRYKFSGKVNFSSEGHPSIEDRAEKYMSVPHVNAGDCCFALWNAVHIMAEEFRYGSRILRNKILIEPKRVIPPDTEIGLAVLVEEEKELILEGVNFSTGKIQGKFSLRGKEVMNITADYCAEIIPI